MKRFKVLALVTMLTMVLAIAAIAYQVDVYDVNLNLEVVEPVDPYYVVTFLDANLEAAIRRELGKPTGDITKEDMAELTSLVANKRGITNLSGLEYAVNLTSLYLSGNQITDITPLAGLTNLTLLVLWGNQITDITSLVDNTGLGYGDRIWLNNNPPLDLTPGSQDMQHIETLRKQGVIVYFDPVVEPIDPYGVVTFPDRNLEDAVRRELRRTGVRITGDITKADMAKLTSLVANGRGITNLSGLEYAVNLTSLTLRYNDINDITPLAGLTNLTTLSLEYNQITDITPLAGLTNLTTLHLWVNQITDITPLAGLTNLTTLTLGGNQITDITPLAGLTNLTALNLEGNQITDMTPLAGLTNLTWLELEFIGKNKEKSTCHFQ